MDERTLCPSEVTGNRACGVAPEQTFGSVSEPAACTVDPEAEACVMT